MKFLVLVAILTGHLSAGASSHTELIEPSEQACFSELMDLDPDWNLRNILRFRADWFQTRKPALGFADMNELQFYLVNEERGVKCGIAGSHPGYLYNYSFWVPETVWKDPSLKRVQIYLQFYPENRAGTFVDTMTLNPAQWQPEDDASSAFTTCQDISMSERRTQFRQEMVRRFADLPGHFSDMDGTMVFMVQYWKHKQPEDPTGEAPVLTPDERVELIRLQQHQRKDLFHRFQGIVGKCESLPSFSHYAGPNLSAMSDYLKTTIPYDDDSLDE
ncbi:MAG: hypothetical protein AB7F86_09450 [Bdellovibrionales bacterium]